MGLMDAQMPEQASASKVPAVLVVLVVAVVVAVAYILGVRPDDLSNFFKGLAS